MRSTFLATLAAALALLAAPVAAKDKAKDLATSQESAALPSLVDASLTNDPENILLLDLSNGGRVAIRLMPQWAPQHVERIKTLVRSGFYNGLIFHRVIDGFMAQTGDPTGSGQGGSPMPDLTAEFNKAPHLRGTVSMARTNDPNSANSQFFIMFYPRFALDNRYTNFGRVIAGMDVVDAIQRGEPPTAPTKILQASLAADNKPPPVVTAAAPASPVAVEALNQSQSN
ncbi:MAG: peptidylprolyl isomerase [Novosphingobium sp.]